jgi:hypothetical protein
MNHNTMNNSSCARSNLGVASTPSAQDRCCVVFHSEEKENIPKEYRMGRVQVDDGVNRRDGAEVGQTFSTFMQAMDQRFATVNEQFAELRQELAELRETNTLQNQELAAQAHQIAHLNNRSREGAGLLDLAARLNNDLQDTITQTRQRNEDLTIDQAAIDGYEWAMCPRCRGGRRVIFCFPCMHTFCFDCFITGQPCPFCNVRTDFGIDILKRCFVQSPPPSAVKGVELFSAFPASPGGYNLPILLAIIVINLVCSFLSRLSPRN